MYGCGSRGVAFLFGGVFLIKNITVVKLSFANGVYQPKTFRKDSEASSRAERRHGWEISFKSALLLVAEGWRPSDRKGKHLTSLVGRFYAKTACQMLACSTIQVQQHSHLAKITPTNGVKCASQLWGRRRRTRRR